MNRSWLIGFVALSLGCRGAFDVDKYQVADSSATGDTVDPSTSTATSTTATSESTTDPTSEASTDTETDTETSDTSDTDEMCPPELGGSCLGVIQVIDVGVPPRDIAIGDVTFDGLDDLLIAAAPVVLLWGVGGRMFGVPNGLLGIDAVGIAIAQLTEDDMPDFVAVGDSSTSLQVSSGNGVFNPDMAVIGGGHDAAFADLFGGGQLVVSGAATLRIYDRESDWAEIATIPGESASIAIGYFDVVDDGFLHVAVTRPASGHVAGLWNDGVTLTGFSPLLTPNVADIIATQLDGGSEEMLAVSDDGLWILRFQDMAFATPITHGVGNSPHAVAAGDVDGDGSNDAVVANFGSQDLSILFGTNGELGVEIRIDVPEPTDMPESLVVHDLDDDGRDEIIVGMLGSNTVVVYGIL